MASKKNNNNKTTKQEEMTMTSTNETTMKTIAQEQTLDEAFASAVGQIPEELIEVEDDKQFERSSETVAIKTIVNRYKKGTISIPACQRLYVWKDSDVNLLIDSINHNFPIGIIMIGECDGKKYLLDGLQRLTSIVKSLSDKSITKEQKNQIMEYRVIVETIRGMDMNDMNAFIQRCNMGVKMSAATKHRAGLPESLFNAVVSIAGKEAFRVLKTNRTFTTSAHNELISMHSLLTAAGILGGKNTASELCKRLKAGEAVVMEHVDEASAQVDFITNAFLNMKEYVMRDGTPEKEAEEMADHISVKGFNVNFTSAMFRMMKRHPEMTEQDVQYMAYQIFNGKNAVKDYAATTSRNSSDEKNMENRLVVLEEYYTEAKEYAEQHKEHVIPEPEWTDADLNADNKDVVVPETSEDTLEQPSCDGVTNEVSSENNPDNSTDTVETTSDDDNIEIIDDVEIVNPDEVPSEKESESSGDVEVIEDNSDVKDTTDDYQTFCESMNDTDIQTKDGQVSVKFECFNDEEKHKLFVAYNEDNNDEWDSVVAFRAAMNELGD